MLSSRKTPPETNGCREIRNFPDIKRIAVLSPYFSSGEDSMKIKSVIGIVFSIVALSLICAADESDYQTGKVVSIHQVQADAQAGQHPDPRPGQTDAPLKSEPVKTYELVVEAGGTSYICHYVSRSDLEPAWTEGNEVKVRVKEDVLYIKNANGKDEKLSIVSSKSKS